MVNGKKSVQGQTTEMFKKVTIKFDGLKNANTFNIYAICSSSRLSTGDPRNQDIFLQKTTFSLVMSRLALGSPSWFGARHQAENGLTHRKMAVVCALVITSRGEALSEKRLIGQAILLQSGTKCGVGSHRTCSHFFWLIARNLTIFDKKYRILTRHDKRESYFIVLQQNNV